MSNLRLFALFYASKTEPSELGYFKIETVVVLSRSGPL